ncbi:MAG: hypothetical protein KatS3mg065_0146 [Chloroflexota bacterium]|nr:MAG: hypothetical protein KatS3mg065_0146 [Chloroflexota bacterium]
MARAKRTDRAEARRRYRAALAAQRSGETAAPAAAATPAATAAPRSGPRAGTAPSPSSPSQTLPSGRMGIVAAFRLAAAPADIRADLAYLPTLVRGTKAIWLPSLVLAAIAAAFLLPDVRENTIAIIVFQTFLVPPPMAGPFLAGLLAPRGAWLAGGVVALVGALLYAGVLLAVPETRSVVEQQPDLAVYAILAAPSFGILVGAFAGFYRRFLRLTSPNQGRRPGRGSRRAAGRAR